MVYVIAAPDAVESGPKQTHCFCAVRGTDGTYTIAEYSLCSAARRRRNSFFEAYDSRDAATAAFSSRPDACPDCAARLRGQS